MRKMPWNKEEIIKGKQERIPLQSTKYLFICTLMMRNCEIAHSITLQHCASHQCKLTQKKKKIKRKGNFIMKFLIKLNFFNLIP
jgi:hypothetical protein